MSDNIRHLRPPMRSLDMGQVRRINEGHCPDCGHRGFVLGPHGGSGQNIECGGCGNRFNVAWTSFSHHVVMAHRIPRQDEGGSDWRPK